MNATSSTTSLNLEAEPPSFLDENANARDDTLCPSLLSPAHSPEASTHLAHMGIDSTSNTILDSQPSLEETLQFLDTFLMAGSPPLPGPYSDTLSHGGMTSNEPVLPSVELPAGGLFPTLPSLNVDSAERPSPEGPSLVARQHTISDPAPTSSEVAVGIFPCLYIMSEAQHRANEAHVPPGAPGPGCIKFVHSLSDVEYWLGLLKPPLDPPSRMRLARAIHGPSTGEIDPPSLLPLNTPLMPPATPGQHLPNGHHYEPTSSAQMNPPPDFPSSPATLVQSPPWWHQGFSSSPGPDCLLPPEPTMPAPARLSPTFPLSPTYVPDRAPTEMPIQERGALAPPPASIPAASHYYGANPSADPLLQPLLYQANLDPPYQAAGLSPFYQGTAPSMSNVPLQPLAHPNEAGTQPVSLPQPLTGTPPIGGPPQEQLRQAHMPLLPPVPKIPQSRKRGHRSSLADEGNDDSGSSATVQRKQARRTASSGDTAPEGRRRGPPNRPDPISDVQFMYEPGFGANMSSE